ncbi:MAG: DUF1028 domain-containing protein [Planctomycetota bacterium]
MKSLHKALLTATLLGCMTPSTASATWSIVLVDKRTGEVGIASVTCLTGLDLRAITPVVLVERGAAAVQAAGDFDGVRRPILRAELLAGTAPADILTLLAAVPGHALRQYGIVDVWGRTATFSGSQNAAWAGGVVGETEDLAYAIQGNILAGSCVVPAIEAALLTNPNELGAKLMAGMLAARVRGGDGRCSCSPAAPTSCGCPVTGKSGHIGYLIVARSGDTDDASCDASGCADGDYYCDLNVAFQSASNVDPVQQLNTQYIVFRNGQLGRPDATRSTAHFRLTDQAIELTIALRDLAGTAVVTPVAVTIEHATGSAGLTHIGPVSALGGGQYRVELVPSPGRLGFDRFRVVADDGGRPVVLMPAPEVCVAELRDCNANGVADGCELARGEVEDANGNGVPDPCERFLRGDCNRDHAVGVADVVTVLTLLFDPAGPEVPCPAACDANDDGAIDLADAVRTSLALFGSSGPLPPPALRCGLAPATNALSCQPDPGCTP